MTVEMITRYIKRELAELEIILDWLSAEGSTEETLKWYAAQQYALEILLSRIECGHIL